MHLRNQTIPQYPEMARPNYSFAKRQREMAKKKKKEEKLKRKAGEKSQEGSDQGGRPQSDNPES